MPQSRIGVLVKRGEKTDLFGRVSWKKRWACLSDGVLTFHETGSDAVNGLHPIKEHRVRMGEYVILVAEHDPLSIVLTPLAPSTTARQWEFKVEHAEERGDWVQSFVEHGCVSEGELSRLREEAVLTRRMSSLN